jgi:hypothetical protein
LHCLFVYQNIQSGLPGHIGFHCQRPNLEACSRNEEAVSMEIERAATVRSVEESIFEANSSKKQQNDRSTQNNRNGKAQYRGGHDHNRRSGEWNSNDNGQSQYGSIDASRNNTQYHDRGRQIDRNQQPQFRPYKSVPPPSTTNRQQDYYSQSEQNNNNKRRHGSSNIDYDISSPQHKRRRYDK